MALPDRGPNEPTPSTSELVDAARRGDQRAWEEIHRRYYAVMRLVLQGRIPGQLRGRFDTEDLLQSGFLQAFRQIDSFTDGSDEGFRRWLTTLMLNKLRDRVRFHRRQRRDGSRDQGSVEAADGKPGTPMEESPSVLMSAAERLTAVLAAIHELEPESQRLIVLRVSDRLSWAAIAERMQLGEATARRRFLEAFEHLVGRIE